MNFYPEEKGAVRLRLVPTKLISADAELADDLYTNDGKTLLKKGSKLTPSLIERINANNIYSVYIKDVHSQAEIQRLVDPVLRLKGYELIKKIFDAVGNRKPDGTHAPLTIMSYNDELNKLMEEIIYEMTGIRDKQLEYIDIKNTKSYIYSSALNTALLSVLIGWEMGLSADFIRQLFIGGIYHDVGMMLAPDEVLYKTEALTMEDKKHIIMHPIVGHNYLKNQVFLSAYVKAIAFQHHENLDGSGYPNRISGEKIHLLSQIVGVADIYDAMTSDRPYRPALPVKDAVEYIMANAGTKYSMEVVNAFVKKINPYPEGSLVKLNNGEIAVVRSVSPEMPLRPVLDIIREVGDNSYRYERVDLLKDHHLIIEGIHF